MTLRTSLLAVCMVAVPAVALFSHRVPADVRAGTRAVMSKAMAWCRDAVLPGHTVPTAASGPAATAATASVVPAAAPPRPEHGADRPEAVLARLGAMSLECRPLPGPAGGHVASCAVPLDAEGQLLRVFHGTGGDRDAALAALATEVDGWRNRFAGTTRRELPMSPVAYP